DFEDIFRMPCDIHRAPRLSTYIVLSEYSPGSQYQRESRGGALVGRNVFGNQEPALSANEFADVHHGGARRRRVVAGPLDRAQAIELLVADARKGRCEARDLIHD